MTTRKSNGQRERDIEQARLDTEAAELRCQRLSYPEIASRQTCAVSTAYERVQRAIAAVPYEAVDELRRVELESLDELETKAREVLLATHYKVDHGKVICLTEDGDPLLDDAPVLQAITSILRIKDMRAKLTGTYAPTKTAVTVVQEGAVDTWIRQLEEELGLHVDSSGDHRGAAAQTEAPG